MAQTNLKILKTAVYGHTDLSWNISGDILGKNPNILSELKWNRLKLVGKTVSICYETRKRYSLSFAYSKRSIVEGTVSDSDYSQDNRNGVISHDVFNSDRGTISDLEIVAGYLPFFRFIKASFLVDFNKKELFLLRESINLNSSYNVSFFGQGVRIDSKPAYGIISFGGTVTVGSYRAYGRWNLRNDLAQPLSFKHKATVAEVGFFSNVDFPICRELSLLARVEVKAGKKISRGTDILFLSDNSVKTTLLRSISLSTYQGQLGLTYKLH